MRKPGERPINLTHELIYFPLRCMGNGNPSERQRAPLCQGDLPVDTKYWCAVWSTTPHMTAHCEACKRRFLDRQKELGEK